MAAAKQPRFTDRQGQRPVRQMRHAGPTAWRNSRTDTPSENHVPVATFIIIRHNPIKRHHS